MDQNIIILVLILIAILVAFYSTYLSIDNSKKIRRLQQDIRESLGNINSTLHLNNDLSSPTVEKPVNNKENKDLEQFPSLEEIENYDNNLQPLDSNLKQELDNILEDEPNLESIPEEQEPNQENKDLEQVGGGEEEVVEVEEVNMETIPEEDIDDDNRDDDLENVDINLIEETIMNIEPSNESNDNESNENESNENSDPKEELVDEVLEETDTEDNKNSSEDSIPVLSELNEDLLRKMSDKNLKIICKRDNIKVRGTKTDRLDRILEAIQYKININ